MSDGLALHATIRNQAGKAVSRGMRLLEKIPAAVYGAGKDPVKITLDKNKVIKVLESEAVYSSILTLDIDGNKEKVILKAIQRDPGRLNILHLDFFRISAKEKLTMNVPIHLIGDEEAPGIKEGGVISHLMTEAEVKCLPADLPEFIEVDVSNMAMGDSIHLSSLKLPSGVELVALSLGEEHDFAVASLHMPKVIEEAPPEEEVAAAEEEGKAAAPEAEAAKEGEGKEASEKES